MIIRFFSISVFILGSCFASISSGRGISLPALPGNSPATHTKSTYMMRGYTLIELIVVIVLLGLMLGVSIPKFRQALLSDSLDTAALRIIGLVQNLRERAISAQVPYILHFDIREKKFWAFAGNASEEVQEAARERAYKLPQDVSIQDVWSWSSGKFFDEGTIRFSRKGYIEQSVIHLQSEDGREVSLELTPFLGLIKIHEGYVDINRG